MAQADLDTITQDARAMLEAMRAGDGIAEYIAAAPRHIRWRVSRDTKPARFPDRAGQDLLRHGLIAESVGGSRGHDTFALAGWVAGAAASQPRPVQAIGHRDLLQAAADALFAMAGRWSSLDTPTRTVAITLADRIQAVLHDRPGTKWVVKQRPPDWFQSEVDRIAAAYEPNLRRTKAEPGEISSRESN